MDQGSRRWIEVTPSQFPHEAEGLRIVRALLPDVAPFRAWSNFEFRDGQGRWHEVDVLVLGRRQLHLVELKYYAGVLRGDDLVWVRDGRRAEDSPLKLARRKAQRLRTKLMDAFEDWARENHQQIPNPRTVIPYVQESVFLHHPGLRCALPPTSRIDLFGPDGAKDHTGLPGISARLLESPSLGEGRQIAASRSDTIAKLLERIGLVQRRQREVGSWIIDEQPLAEGEGWQDWPAFHKVAGTERARIRFYVTPPGAPSAEAVRLRKVAENEYRVTSRLNHDGLLKPRDLVQDELGTGLVYPHDQRFQRLDLWLAELRDGIPVSDQLALLREVAEAVAYAHRHRVVHRGLTPLAVWVRRTSTGGLRVLLGDWQSAGRVRPGAAGSTSGPGLSELGETALAASERFRAIFRPGADADRRFAEVFQAPEGVWNRAPNRIPLDVFSLGALAYYLLTGQPPAADRAALRERLVRDDGLDLAAELPQVSPALRRLVLDATRRAVTERLADVPRFLARLGDAERELATPEHLVASDPLEAGPGAVLAGRFRLERRLGAGSTAVGLLVTDLSVADGELRVLKVARDDAAGQRLVDEAEVLRGLRHPRVVRLVEGPLELGGRRVLLLEFAGEQTLAEVLPERARLSLDLLERWGTELLEALVALDRAGVDHRDVKPANLGVREGRGDRVKHLTLFDFSLTRAGATAVNAGTPPYLDPFLEGRGRYDSAAERYAAAVVLFEMATGQTPAYGDGQTHPAVVDDEATVVPELFDPAVAARLVPFFRTALARQARSRHDTVSEMLAEWRAAFVPLSTTDTDDADARAAAATAETRLVESGLTARALSALEPLDLVTVADLLAVDPVRLSRMSGVANATRREITARAKAWRVRLGAGTERRSEPGQPDLVEAATLLVEHAGSSRAVARRRAARLLLGLESGLDAFATPGELARVLDATRARGSQLVASLQQAWADHGASVARLDRIAALAREALDRLGGVAEVGELAEEILGQSPPSDHPDARRLAAGLLRVAVDRADELERAGGLKEGESPFVRRRHGGRTVLLATSELHLDAADAVTHAAQRLVADARAAGEPVVPRQRAAEALAGVAGRIVPDEPDAPDLGGDRLVRLAGRLSRTVAASGRGELHDRGMPAVDAVRLTLSGLSGQQPMRPQEVADRVRARFPALPPLPGRPRLDEVIAEAGLPLVFDEAAGVYRAVARQPDTTGLGTRPPTFIVLPPGPDTGDGYAARRFGESVGARSFLAIGVEAARMGRAVSLLHDRYGARVLDLTGVLVGALRDRARAAGVPWDAVRAADAARPGTRDALGLAVLVEQSLPDVEQAVASAAAEAPEGGWPLVLVDLAPLARYGHLNLLSRWTDLTARRRQAVWAVVPQLVGNHGPLVDGRPLPLAAPGQFLRLNAEWFADPGVTATEGVST